MKSVLVNVRTILAGSRSIDIIRPMLDFGRTLHPLRIRFILEVTDAPGEEPGEHDGHDKPNGDDTDDEDEGNIKNDLGGDTTDTLGVDEPNSDDVLQTMTHRALVGPKEVHRQIFAAIGGIRMHHRIEKGRIIDFRFAQPLEEIEIKNAPVCAGVITVISTSPRKRNNSEEKEDDNLRFEYCKIPTGITNIIPRVVDLSQWVHR